MKKLINNFCTALCALIICTGLVFTGCTDGPLGNGAEQGTNQNNGNGDDGGSDINGPVDLSKKGTANSYIVSASGAYNFTPTKGNSAESVGQIASVEVLWESFGTDVTPNVGDLVKHVKYENGVISFDTPENFQEGNAVIAAKDANGTILWSWHIWLTDQPKGQVYYNNAGTMMDRNLGATSATPGDVGALGLHYEWGRKDPFLGPASISSDILANSTIIWPSPVRTNATTGTIEFATANPTTYIRLMEAPEGIYGSEDYYYCEDWYYTKFESESAENARWTGSSNKKSVYDPCPSGWRVPDGGENSVWAKALGSSSEYVCQTFDVVNKGINFSGKFGDDSTIWYPAAGDGYGDEYGLVGALGAYWSSYADGWGCCLSFDYYDHECFVAPDKSGPEVYGKSVRCIQE